MTVDRPRRDYPPLVRSQRLRAVGLRWLVRMKLRGVLHRIDALERQLAAEFATVETRPMIEELQALLQRRDELQARLNQIS